MQQMQENQAQVFEPIPEKFEEYFTKLFSQTDPPVTYSSIKTSLQQLYQNSLHENNLREVIIEKLGHTGFSTEDLQKVVQDFEKLRTISQKFNKLLPKIKNIEDLSQNFRADLKFDLFFNKNLLDAKELCWTMEEDYILQIEEVEGCEDQLIEFLSLEEDELKQRVERFLNGAFEMYMDFSEEQKSQILNLFLNRNLVFSQIKDSFEMIVFEGEQPDLTQMIFSFYEQVQQPEEPEIPEESKEDFVTRVQKFFAGYEDKKKKNKCVLPSEKEALNLGKLYDYRRNLVKQKIIEIISVTGGYVLFNKKPQAVTDDIVKKIYNIPEDQVLNYVLEGEQKQQIPIKPSQKGKNKLETPNPNGNIVVLKRGRISDDKGFNQNQSKLNKQTKKQDSLKTEIEELESEIKGIQSLLKQYKATCLQIMMRKLEIHLRENKFEEIQSSTSKIQEILKRYNLEFKFGARLQALCKEKQFARKVPLMLNIRRDLFGLNLEHIKQVKQQIEARKQCQDADAIVIIGNTGVGKTTLIVGLSGYQLVKASETGDYRPKSSDVAKKYKVSNNTMSETRWANVSYLSSNWSKSKIVIIDTPGLEDNRSSEIDITNNIATVKMLKSLHSARFVVGLSEKQFGDRWYDSLKKLIRGISKYITAVECFSKNLTFVLSKGLTIQRLSYEFQEFKNSASFDKEDWSDNETDLINIFGNKIKQYKQKQIKAVEIIDPSIHNYQELAAYILKGTETKCPGQYISTSFSREALMHMDWSIEYLKSMCMKTLQLKQFQLTEYYINELKDLEKVSDKQNLTAEIQKYAEDFFEEKITSCETYLNKFYDEGSEVQYLTKFKEIKGYLLNLEKYSLLTKFIFDGKQSPRVRIQKMISLNLEQDIKLLKDPSAIEPSKKKKVLKSLKLIKEFRSEHEYQYFVKQIQTENEGILNNLTQIIKDPKFDDVEWKKCVFKFRNMFNLEDVTLTEIEDMKRLKEILKKYFDNQPQQMQEIRKFLEIAQTQSLEGDFFQVCSGFINKLNKLKETHYVIKDFIQPKMKELMGQLEKLIVFYQIQKDSIMEKLDIKQINNVIIYEKNSKEVYEILTKFDSSQMNQFKSQKEEQSTLNRIKDRLCQKIISLEQEIDKLALNPENIEPKDINEVLQTIFTMIEYINKRREAVEKEQEQSAKNPQNQRVIKRQLEFLKQTIRVSDQNLKKIYRKIQKTSQISNVEDFKLNFKLIICLLVLKEFSVHFLKYFKDMEENMNNVEINLKEKLQYPLRQLQAASFSTDFEYNKLQKMLIYMQDLNQTVQKLTQKAQEFDFLIHFTKNKEIKEVIEKSFSKIMDDEKQFECVKQLLSYHKQIEIASSKELKQAHATKKEKNLNELCYSLLNKSVKYIKSYDYIKQISANFNNISIVESFRNEKLENLDYCSEIVERLEKIQAQLKDEHRMTKISRKDLVDLHKEYKFLNGIYEKVKGNRVQVFNDIEKTINKELLKFIADFEGEVTYLTEVYKQIKHGVEFEPLKKLLAREDFKDEANKRKFEELLGFIGSQYNRQLGELFFVVKTNEDKLGKIQVFINVYQFMQICKETHFKFNFTFANMLDDVCDSFFEAMGDSFDNILEKTKKGKKIDENEINKLKEYEKKINFYLKDKYEAYKQRKGLTESYEKKFTKQRDEALNTVKNNYITQGIVDGFFKDFFLNSDPDQQVQMKKTVLQKNKTQETKLEALLQSDHEKMYEIIDKKIEEIQFLPDAIQTEVKETLKKINEKKEKLEFQVKQNVVKFVQQENAVNLLKEYKNAKDKNSKNLKILTQTGIQTYVNQEIKKLDFKKPSQMREILKKNEQFTSSQIYKSLEQHGDVIAKIEAQFITQAKTEAKAETNSIHEELVKFKKDLLLTNPKDEFKIYEFKTVPCSSTTKAAELINLFKEFSILQDEHKEIKNIVETEIRKEKKSFKDNSQKLVEIKQNISEKKKLYKTELVQTLRNCFTSKTVYSSYKEFNELEGIDEKVELNEIKAFESIVTQIEDIFIGKYRDARSTKIEDYVSNDTKDRIQSKIKEIDEDMKFLGQFTGIFIPPSQIPENLIGEIQENNRRIYNEFLQKTQQEVHNSFSFEKDLDRGEKARQNDMLCRLIKENDFKSFPSNLVLEGEKINKKIVEKFKENINTIQYFIEVKQEIYKELLQNHQNISKEEKRLTEEQNKLLDQEKLKTEEAMKEIFETKIKTVGEEDPDKDQKKADIEKQVSGEKDSQISMLELKIKKEKETIKANAEANKLKVEQEIKILAKELAQKIVIDRRARSYYNYEEIVRNYHIRIESLMEKVLQKFKKKFIGTLYNTLKDCESSYSQVLIDEQKVFLSYKALEFANLAKGQTFDKLILQVPQIKASHKKTQILLKKHKDYEKIYDGILENYRVSPDFKDQEKKIIETIFNYSERLKNQYLNNVDSKLERHVLLAYIFALWTILKSDFDEEGNIIFVYRPHPGQILAIFLLLEFDNENSVNRISKSMVQVSTGEGKSVILGALSAYLALVGFKVYEACYSLYLSQRDYKDFEPLFTCLNIKDKIHYNIFPEIFKMMLDEGPNITFKDKMQNFLNTKSLWGSITNFFKTLIPNHKNSNNILLIDEADVFLDENYIGESFFPGISLECNALRAVFDLIWSLKGDSDKLQPKSIVASTQFTKLCDELGHDVFKQIVMNQVHAMVRDIEKYTKDVYTVVHGRIYYKEGDGLSDKIHYGYRTIWAYYHEHFVNNVVSANELNKQICIKLVIASFSYAKLPSYFKSILGVTGTLEAMADPQKDILVNDFQVGKRFVQPSIYPKSNKTIQFRKCNALNLNDEIIQNITLEHQRGRPIIVFFKTKSETYNFFDCPEFRPFRSQSSVITYEVSPEDRDVRIQTATLEGRITLLTDDFSRGTDFKLKTKNSAQHPGLHVISSFLPKSFCDYIQLAGRTGRQGKNGSVMIFMLEDAPQQAQVKQEDAEKTIKQKDNKHWSGKMIEIRKKIEAANKEHDENTKLYTSSPGLEAVLKNLYNLNVQPEMKRANSRTAICIDGTISMSDVFPRVVTVVQDAIPNIYEVIKQAQVQGSFDIKFVIYRNYNSTEDKLIEFSNYENKSDVLSKWIGAIEVDGGWGNEAIEVCLSHLNSLEKLNQFIIIGDAKANTEQDTKIKRKESVKRFGRQWDSKGFKETYYEQELNKLINRKIKGHSYYLNPTETKEFFEDLSKRTSGKCEEFRIHDSNATKMFTDFVANRILENLGDCFDEETKKKMLQIYAKVANRKIY